MRLSVRHTSSWAFRSPALLGPHVIRLRPASHVRIAIDDYTLEATPHGALRWLQDPTGNHLARLTYPTGTATDALQIDVRFACAVHTINPFDFLVDASCATAPFTYPDSLCADLAPALDRDEPALQGGPQLSAFLAALPGAGDTVQLLVALNAAVNRTIRYVEREEPGIWTPERTLTEQRGSCRDSAVLLMAALRSRGIAARFASGYLIQLAHEPSVVGEVSTVPTDSVALHAWAEAYLPGAGWIGLDATSGLLCGEGHIPLAATAVPANAAPVEGTSDLPASAVTFTMSVARLGADVGADSESASSNPRAGL